MQEVAVFITIDIPTPCNANNGKTESLFNPTVFTLGLFNQYRGVELRAIIANAEKVG